MKRSLAIAALLLVAVTHALLRAHLEAAVERSLFPARRQSRRALEDFSRSIVERHDGRLWAEPNPDSPGATFLLSIPNDQHQ